MNEIKNITISKCISSPYIKPVNMNYEQNGQQKQWHLMKVHDSVAIIMYNVSRKVMLFVKQFRPAIYYSDIVKIEDTPPESIDCSIHPVSNGFTLELCAGIVDKDLSLKEIAKEEMLEECGYDVPLSSIEKITSFRSGVGIIGSTQTLFYVEVTNEMKIQSGGGNHSEGEFIEVVELSISETKNLMKDEKMPRPGTLMFALSWFLHQKLPQLEKDN